MLYLQLIHNPSKWLFQFVHFFVEFFSNFHFELVVEVLIYWYALVVFINLYNHLLNHLFHFFNFWRNLDHFVLHFCVLEDAFGAEHGAVVLTIKFDFLLRMDFTETDRGCGLVRCLPLLTKLTSILSAHRQCRKYLVVHGQVFWGLVVRDFVVGALDHLMLIKLLYTLIAEGVTAG